MGKNRKDKFWESGLDNNATYMQYYNRLVELSISAFKWSGLPDSVDERYLELVLFSDGQAVFFEDEELGYLTLQNAMNGGFNVYRIPKNRRAYSVNGYQKKLSEEDSVIIFNNMLHTNSRLDVSMFAKRLYNLDRIIDVNANAQKTPLFIQCSKPQELTLKNLYKEYTGNEPVIYSDTSLGQEPLRVLKTDAPYVCDKIYELKTKIWNEALTYLGISNVSVEKKERLITDEVDRSQGGVLASRYSRLISRQQACKKINDMFGLDIWCEYREDYNTDNEEDNNNESEGEGDE